VPVLLFEQGYKKMTLSSYQHKHKKRNKQEIEMSTTIAGGSKQKKDELEVVIKYIKDDLFAKVKFIYDPEVDLAVGGKIYADYKRKCGDQIGGIGLSAAGHDTYMEAVWTSAMTKHIQKNALAQKRSAVYTVMQNKFSGKSVPNFCSEQVYYLLLILLKFRFVSSLCRQKMCHVVPRKHRATIGESQGILRLLPILLQGGCWGRPLERLHGQQRPTNWQ
jgi:hypothetical protein